MVRAMTPGSARVTGRLLGIALLLAAMPSTAVALSSDRSQPMTIEADRATLNEKTGNSVYEGNVHVQQGSLVLQGSKMTVELNDNTIEKIILIGNPATWKQRPDGKDKDQHAEAGRIEYHATEDRIILLENARVWQSGAEEFRSDRIVFNLKSNTVNAGGDSPGDRVHITLQPGSKKDKQPTVPPQ
jgi:lipopolysaccharide export system protein LptA